MNTIDLTPLYRSSVGYDRFGALVNAAMRSEKTASGYPPYNIVDLADDKYAITVAVSGFKEHELNIQLEKGVLTVSGKKEKPESEVNYLHQGIATRSFERKFNLAEHIEVVNADLSDGMLTVSLLREVPEKMKARTISIGNAADVLEHKAKKAA
ncbi:MAG: molecular chaperone IbpA [Saprospiraceae bacterium]|jgi:molecular chaperone IbpA